MRLRKQIRRFQWDRGSRFSGLNETAEAASTVSIRSPNPFWHRGSLLKNEYLLSIPLKGYYNKNIYICKHYILIVTRKRSIKGELQPKKVVFRGLIETAEAEFWRFLNRISKGIRSNMRCGFSTWTRAPGWVDWWKKPRVKGSSFLLHPSKWSLKQNSVNGPRLGIILRL
jgi:hypothetical protein